MVSNLLFSFFFSILVSKVHKFEKITPDSCKEKRAKANSLKQNDKARKKERKKKYQIIAYVLDNLIRFVKHLKDNYELWIKLQLCSFQSLHSLEFKIKSKSKQQILAQSATIEKQKQKNYYYFLKKVNKFIHLCFRAPTNDETNEINNKIICAWKI